MHGEDFSLDKINLKSRISLQNIYLTFSKSSITSDIAKFDPIEIRLIFIKSLRNLKLNSILKLGIYPISEIIKPTKTF